MQLAREKLKEERLRRALSQADLAEMAGMTEATVNRLELGLRSARVSSIRKLAAALEVAPEVLIDWQAPDDQEVPAKKAAA